MTPVAALSSYFRKYFDFTGRAPRREYLLMALWSAGFYLPITFLMLLPSLSSGYSATGSLFTPIGLQILMVSVAIIVPTLSLLVRRLHDANYSGWVALLLLVPYLGWLAVFTFALLPSNPLAVRFDKDPCAQTAEPTWQSTQRPS